MTREPLPYQTPPPRDSRRFRAANVLWGFLCGSGVAGVCIAVVCIALTFLYSPWRFTLGTAAVCAVLVNLQIGRDIENASEHRGFMLGMMAAVPVWTISCASTALWRPLLSI